MLLRTSYDITISHSLVTYVSFHSDLQTYLFTVTEAQAGWCIVYRSRRYRNSPYMYSGRWRGSTSIFRYNQRVFAGFIRLKVVIDRIIDHLIVQQPLVAARNGGIKCNQAAFANNTVPINDDFRS